MFDDRTVPIRYEERVVELVKFIRSRWTDPDAERAAAAEEEITLVEVGDELVTRRITTDPSKVWTKFDTWVGSLCDGYNLDSVVRQAVDQKEAENTLLDWLEQPPIRLLSSAAYELGCPGVDRAKTQREVATAFLTHFGYQSEESMAAPTGIASQEERIVEADNTLRDVTVSEASAAEEQATRVGKAMEGTLQILVAFYGLYLFPEVFADYAKRPRGVHDDSEESVKLLRAALLNSPLKEVRADVERFLDKQWTQLELLARILAGFERQLISDPSLATTFGNDFGRGSIFPRVGHLVIDREGERDALQPMPEQLTRIKNLRNLILHSPHLLAGLTQDPEEMLASAREMCRDCKRFFKSGRLLGLFPQMMLVKSVCQNVNKRWRVTAITEKCQEVSFHVPERSWLETYTPNCEVICWPADTASKRPAVARLLRCR
jgi:hypothetical protein